MAARRTFYEGKRRNNLKGIPCAQPGADHIRSGEPDLPFACVFQSIGGGRPVSLERAGQPGDPLEGQLKIYGHVERRWANAGGRMAAEPWAASRRGLGL